MKLPWQRRSDAVYETLKAAFDRDFYLRGNPDVARANVNPVRHYIHSGAAEGRDPTPGFSTRYYLETYPDVAESGVNPFYHYLTVGRSEGRIAHAFEPGSRQMQAVSKTTSLSPAEAAEALRATQQDIRERLDGGVLGVMVAGAARLEPLIHHPSHDWLDPEVPPFRPSTVFLIEAMERLREMAQTRRAAAVVAIPHCRMSGAARVAGELAFALASIHGPDQVVVVRTDLSRLEYPEWFPEGCRHVDFASIDRHLNDQERQIVLFHFLRSLDPERVFNVNSGLLWDLLPVFGAMLNATVPTYAYLFCSEQDERGREKGYPVSHFHRCFPALAGIVTDSDHLAGLLRQRFRLGGDDADKIAALTTPVRGGSDAIAAPEDLPGRRPRVFWAGRFDRQKRVDVALTLAKRMPDVDFLVWGKPVGGAPVDVDDEDLPPNFQRQGTYRNFNGLPLETCDAWLYTSQWDGVPTTLLDVAAAGVPLVASLAGGTGEVLRDGLCHRIETVDDVDAFEAAIRAVLADPATARANARRMREDILAARTIARYRSELEAFVTAREHHDRH